MSISRAVELAAAAQRRAYPKPTVGAVIVRDGEIVGEGVTEAGGRHAEIVALEAAGERAGDSTLYVTLEPCAHHGTTPPCTEAILADGVERVVVGSRDPNPEAAGGVERLRAHGVDVEFVDSWEARTQNEAWRVWVRERRPFVIYKAATTLDGRVVVPGRRWVTGAESRLLVHELRAESMPSRSAWARHEQTGPVSTRATSRRRSGQPRRLVFGRGRCQRASTSSCEVAHSARNCRALAADGVQSLLLEGGPTLAAAFLEADLVDKLLRLRRARPRRRGARLDRFATLTAHADAPNGQGRWVRMCSLRRMSTSPEQTDRADDQIVST